MSRRSLLLLAATSTTTALAAPSPKLAFTFWAKIRIEDQLERYKRPEEDTLCRNEHIVLFLALARPAFVYALKFLQQDPPMKVVLHASASLEKAGTELRLDARSWLAPEPCDETEAIYLVSAPRRLSDEEQWKAAKNVGLLLSPSSPQPCDDDSGIIDFIHKGNDDEQRTKHATPVNVGVNGVAVLRLKIARRSCVRS